MQKYNFIAGLMLYEYVIFEIYHKKKHSHFKACYF